MKRKIIQFVSAGKAELTDEPLRGIADDEALVENEISAISAGTERANLMDLPNLGGPGAAPGQFPKRLGYSGVGRVAEVGKNVRGVKAGDRVLTHWGSCHSSFNYISENNLVKIDDDALPSEHAVFGVIGGFSLGGLRKTRLEIGESAAVVGLGILGVFAVALCRVAGAAPCIASDLSEARRKLALSLGAHHVFNPADADYIEKVRAAARGGVNAIIEVTGQSVALKQSLGFAARFGRVALLGCTRVSDAAIDFYQEVHRPGVELIGAHTQARPEQESRPHAWTWRDDARAVHNFMSDGRIDMAKILSAVHSPLEAPAVYTSLAQTPQDFPIGAVFDWRLLK
ncbi:zinc-dependent alcohol dehydrogenase [Ereboglobus luteus]|uniref:Theronine dehydrogenase n=1 Tax=Ereboglobus luteus TaxID=1796921 RepID=A0A2U8E6A9_9BACT|nr:zinc-binding alcohol dehydrogenase [Ereboglobus luteus]AWI10295.1 theronine dehydrogenase [Ereboglobus luteus]